MRRALSDRETPKNRPDGNDGRRRSDQADLIWSTEDITPSAYVGTHPFEYLRMCQAEDAETGFVHGPPVQNPDDLTNLESTPTHTSDFPARSGVVVQGVPVPQHTETRSTPSRPGRRDPGTYIVPASSGRQRHASYATGSYHVDSSDRPRRDGGHDVSVSQSQRRPRMNEPQRGYLYHRDSFNSRIGRSTPPAPPRIIKDPLHGGLSDFDSGYGTLSNDESKVHRTASNKVQSNAAVLGRSTSLHGLSSDPHSAYGALDDLDTALLGAFPPPPESLGERARTTRNTRDAGLIDIDGDGYLSGSAIPDYEIKNESPSREIIIEQPGAPRTNTNRDAGSSKVTSPITKVESWNRGDSPERDFRRRPSQSTKHLQVNDDQSDDDNEDFSDPSDSIQSYDVSSFRDPKTVQKKEPRSKDPEAYSLKSPIDFPHKRILKKISSKLLEENLMREGSAHLKEQTPHYGPNSSPPSPPSFRNVSACNRCRMRKNRCDQGLPRCAFCEKAGVPCVGYDPITKREIPRSYVYFLETRVAYLEKVLVDNQVDFKEPAAFDEDAIETGSYDSYGTQEKTDGLDIEDTANARTKIDRKLVSPEVLEAAGERFEEVEDYLIVLRVLTKDEIQEYAERTREMRTNREGDECVSLDKSHLSDKEQPKVRSASFHSNWELPSVVENIPDPERFLLGQITLTQAENSVKVCTCEQYIREVYGESGIALLGNIIKAIQSESGFYGDDDMEIQVARERIEVLFDTSETDTVGFLQWLCLTFRQPVPGSVSYSTGYRLEEMLELKPLWSVKEREEVSWNGICWSELFESAVIAWDQRVRPGRTDMLDVEFNLMVQLAAVEYPVMVDGGIVLMGYSTALISIEQDDETITWHLETANHDAQFKVTELESIKGPWFKSTKFEDLQSKKALLGWCPEAVMLLGTGNMTTSVKWSNAKLKQTSWHWKGANIQLLAQSASPLQIGGQAGLSFDRTVNTLKFSPARNYLKCLNSSAMEQIVIYDVSEKRAWLVPLLCVLHQMLLVYWKSVPEEFRKVDIPLAQPASDGALASMMVLRDNGSCVVEESENEQLTVRDLIMGFSVNLSKTSLQQPRRSEIYGYEFMDIIMDSTKTELKRNHIDKEGLAWSSLLNEVNCLFCSGLGDAMLGLRADTPKSPCNYLLTGQDWMATSIRSIDALSRKQGSDAGLARRLSSHHFWLLKGTPFQRCQHGKSGESCWRTNSMLQEIQNQKSFWVADKQAEGGDFPNGAVVFGRGRKTHCVTLLQDTRGVIEISR